MTGAPRLVAVPPFLALVGATIAAFILCEEGGEAAIATSLIIAIAAFKIHLVVGHFMEVRWSTGPWRIALEAWIGIVTAIILGAYWFSLI